MAISLPIVSKFDDKGINQAEGGLNRLGGFAKGAGIAIAAGLAVAGAAAIGFGVASVKAAAEAEAVTKGLENAAKNAGVFGDSAASIGKATEALDKHSTALAEMTGIDDEIINQIKTGWLAVPSLAAMGTEGINNLAKVTADVAAGTGKDVQAIGLAFQRVAGDTESAFSKLTRAGIVFTDEQKATFDSLLETNGEMAAQEYLIGQLGDKYEGAAQAMANPFDRLNVIFENLKETIGAAMLPAIEQIIPKVQDFVSKLTASPEFETFLVTLADSFLQLLDALMPLLQPITDLMLSLLPPLLDIVALLAPQFANLVEKLIPLLDPIMQLVETLLPPAVELFAALVGLLVDNPEFMDSAIQGFKDMNEVAKVLAGFLKTIADFLTQISGNHKASANLKYMADQGYIKATNPFSMAQSSWMAKGGTLNLGYPGQAEGGVTTRGGMSWVGENGPELLNLPKGAQVIPLDRLGGGGGGATVNITVNAGLGTDGAALGEQVVNAIRRYERSSGAVFAKA